LNKISKSQILKKRRFRAKSQENSKTIDLRMKNVDEKRIFNIRRNREIEILKILRYDFRMKQQKREREKKTEIDETKAENDQEKIENCSIKEIEKKNRSRSLNQIFREKDEVSTNKNERIATLV
jgi:hypothetical protein